MTVFTRNVMNGSEPTWLLHADSEITAYNDVAGARWYFARLLSTMRGAYVWGATTLGSPAGQAAIRIPFRTLPVSAIGDAHAAFTATWGGDEVAYTTRIVIFRRSRYVVFLRVIGLVEQTLVPRVMGVDRRIDHRIRGA